MSRKSRDRFAFETPEHLFEAALKICVELDREYPYLADFQLEGDGAYRLISLHTISRSMRSHYGEMIGTAVWDVDWIERDQHYAFHQSGWGGSLRLQVSGIYWRHPDMEHVVREQTARYRNRQFRKRNKTRRIRRIPIELEGYSDLMQWLNNTASESDTYYCTVCRERLPDNNQCAHVWDCEDAVLRGPGSEEDPEPCDSEDCYYCSRNRLGSKA